MMKESTKVWDVKLEEALERIVGIFRKSLIVDTEAFAQFNKDDNCCAQGLETALYKTTLTMNECNKAAIIQRYGPERAGGMFNSLLDQAMSDVSLVVLEDLEAHLDDLPPEIQDILKKMRKIIGKKDNDGTKET